MTGDVGRDVAEIGVRLLDDAHMAWFAAESECEHALRAWFRGVSGKRVDAYLAYLAALDREEAAARDLQRLDEVTEAFRKNLAPREEGVLG